MSQEVTNIMGGAPITVLNAEEYLALLNRLLSMPQGPKRANPFPTSGGFRVEFTSKAVAEAEAKLKEAAKAVADLQGQWTEYDLELQGLRDPERRGHLQRRNEILAQLDIPEAEEKRTAAMEELRKAKISEARAQVREYSKAYAALEQTTYAALVTALKAAADAKIIYQRMMMWNSYSDNGPSPPPALIGHVADLFHSAFQSATPMAAKQFAKSVGLRFGLEVARNGKPNGG